MMPMYENVSVKPIFLCFSTRSTCLGLLTKILIRGRISTGKALLHKTSTLHGHGLHLVPGREGSTVPRHLATRKTLFQSSKTWTTSQRGGGGSTSHLQSQRLADGGRGIAASLKPA